MSLAHIVSMIAVGVLIALAINAPLVALVALGLYVQQGVAGVLPLLAAIVIIVLLAFLQPISAFASRLRGRGELAKSG